MNSLEAWENAGWELLAETPLSPAFNVSLEEVLIEAVGAGRRAPLLRFWGWTERATIIGRFQSLANEIDADAANEMGIKVVRRSSGGGTMFVEPEKAITYSLYLPVGFV